MAKHDILRAGEQDWAAIWRAMYAAEREQAESVTPEGLVDPADYWATTARRFQAAARQSAQPDSFMQVVLPHLRPGDRVADIGAGSGRYLSTLAPRVREVVAVEPSPSMRGYLRAEVEAQRLSNVTIVEGAWPDADLGRVDVALSAHVLYSVADAAPFLRAMDACATRACFLYLFFKHPLAALAPFWQRLRGEERLRLPSALEALNLLHQLGIPANMQVVTASSQLRYADAEEALVDVRWRLRFAPDPVRDAAILQDIDALMAHHDDGLVPAGLPATAAVVWWEHTDG